MQMAVCSDISSNEIFRNGAVLIILLKSRLIYPGHLC